MMIIFRDAKPQNTVAETAWRHIIVALLQAHWVWEWASTYQHQKTNVHSHVHQLLFHTEQKSTSKNFQQFINIKNCQDPISSSAIATTMSNSHNIKVKLTLEQAMKAQGGVERDTALLFL